MRRAIFVPLLIILAVVAILGGVGYWSTTATCSIRLTMLRSAAKSSISVLLLLVNCQPLALSWAIRSLPVKLLVRSLAHQERRHLQLPRRSAAPLMVLSCRYRPYKARVSLPA